MPTAIEWAEEVWNPITGCDKVSPGCDNCYALTLAKRLKAMGQPKYQNDGDPRTSGPGFGLTLHTDTLGHPHRWKQPRRVFVNSMSDLFHPDVPLDFILDVWSTMANTPQHTFQILTKRPQRMRRIVSAIAWAGGVNGEPWEAYAWPGTWEDDHGDLWDTEEDDLDGGGEVPLPNVWLGTSIESDRYTFRADHLRNTPAAVRWISAEPLLGPLPSLDLTGIDWLVVGGESGPNHRPIDPNWVRELRDEVLEQDTCPECGDAWIADDDIDPRCQWCDNRGPRDRAPRTAFLLKQWGGRTSKAGGRELDGRTWDEYPEVR